MDFALAFVLFAFQSATATERVDITAIERRVAEIVPTLADERWLALPWQSNLMGARALAQEQGKPVLLWVMDGNTLGCT